MLFGAIGEGNTSPHVGLGMVGDEGREYDIVVSDTFPFPAMVLSPVSQPAPSLSCRPEYSFADRGNHFSLLPL